jgi:hypothetical protein
MLYSHSLLILQANYNYAKSEAVLCKATIMAVPSGDARQTAYCNNGNCNAYYNTIEMLRYSCTDSWVATAVQMLEARQGICNNMLGATCQAVVDDAKANSGDCSYFENGGGGGACNVCKDFGGADSFTPGLVATYKCFSMDGEEIEGSDDWEGDEAAKVSLAALVL